MNHRALCDSISSTQLLNPSGYRQFAQSNHYKLRFSTEYVSVPSSLLVLKVFLVKRLLLLVEEHHWFLIRFQRFFNVTFLSVGRN